MKIYTQNLHNYMEENRILKLEKIAKYIYENKIDIICLQEVGQTLDSTIVFKEGNIRQDNLALILQTMLLDKYNLKYNLSCTMFKVAFDKYEEGLAILSLEEFESEEMFISNANKYNDWLTRKALIAKVKDFYVINTHFGWTMETENFYEQFKNILKYKEHNHLLCGDFNVGYGSVEYEYIFNNLYQGLDLVKKFSDEVSDTSTFDYGEGKIEVVSGNGRIDHIFGSIKKVLNAEIVFEHGEVSDHRGVMVDVEEF